jgi:hypothetical protein
MRYRVAGLLMIALAAVLASPFYMIHEIPTVLLLIGVMFLGVVVAVVFSVGFGLLVMGRPVL